MIDVHAAAGRVVAQTKVSPEDYGRLVKHYWRIVHGHASRWAGGTVYMHREILGLERGNPLEGDHINLDPLDNRRGNLRAVTGTRNRRNLRGRPGTSPFRGVSWHKKAEKWQGTATYDGRCNYLGLHADEDDAARAVNAFWLAHGCEAPNAV